MSDFVDNVNVVHELQNAQLCILEELDRVCKVLDLTYCLAFGTALGAIRHKGFIPWDDDVDVYMRIEDLEKLQNNSDLFAKGFFLQHHNSDPEFGLMITRLRNSNTTLIEKTEINRDINHGVFIDIYPLFNIPAKGWKAYRLVITSMFYRLMLYGVVPQNRGKIMKFGSTILLKITTQKMRDKIIKCCFNTLKSTKKTGFISSLYGDEANIRYPEECFFPVKWVPFDRIMAPVMCESDKYLTMTYGDYLKLPPVEKRVFHHNYAFVDLKKTYVEYKGKVYCKGRY